MTFELVRPDALVAELRSIVSEGPGAARAQRLIARLESVLDMRHAEPRELRRHATLDAEHLEHQRAFSLATFGPGARTAGVLDHIRKELIEIEDRPADITEWADLLILAFDGAMRADHEPQAIIDAVKEKQAVNEARSWPDWRTQDPDKAIEHIRASDDQPGRSDGLL